MAGTLPSPVVVLTLAMVQGFISMGFQLVASRLLAPYFGTTLIVWAFLISTFLAAFGAGAFLGGGVSRLPNAQRRRALIGQSIAGGAFFALVAFAGRPLLGVIEPAFAALWSGLAVACALLFLVPVAALSGTLPVLAELLADRGARTGVSSGLVYGVSTVGNIAGVMVTAFLLIPNFPTSELLVGWFIVSLVCFFGIARTIPS